MSSEIRQLELLLEYPNENLEREYKNWLDISTRDGQADVAKALIALANHGGGYVVIGFSDINSVLTPDASRPADLAQYSQDRINGVIRRYADPVFHCECREIYHPSSGLPYPIIIVPGGHRTPIRTCRGGPNGRYFNQNVYLIRRPGPSSEEPQTASEWDELISRCVMNNQNSLLESIRSIISGTPQVAEIAEEDVLTDWMQDSINRFNELVSERFPNEDPSRYASGTWSVGYQLLGDINSIRLSELNQILRDIQGRETGWPVWLYLSSHSTPYSHENTIESLIEPERSPDGAHSDFWRASPDGLMYLERGYQEDGLTSSHESGTIFDFTLPIWRISECVLHASRLAQVLSEESILVSMSIRWGGMSNRRLTSWAEPRYFVRGGVCRTDSVRSRMTFRSDQVESNLHEIVGEMLIPLYEAFDFTVLPESTLLSEIRKLRDRT